MEVWKLIAILRGLAVQNLISYLTIVQKEVSHLRSLANGGSGNHDSEARSMSLLGSPGAFKWEGLGGNFSPLASDKRLSQKKEYEVALVGAFRREKDKDLALQSLTAENKAAMHLVIITKN